MQHLLRSLNFALMALVGVVALGTTQSTVQLLVNAPHALIMGGTTNPDPSPDYVDNQVDNYIAVGFPDGDRYPVHTPQEFWPVYGTATFDQSTAQGLVDVATEMAKPGHSDAPLVILGYSSSTRIASAHKNSLIVAQDFDREIDFVLVSDVNKGNGGMLARFPGWEIPVLGVTFDGATRTDSPEIAPDDYALDTTSVTIVHDGWSDFPIYPLNLLALANSLVAIGLVHPTYPDLDQPELTSIGRTGDTEYYVIETEIVPILMPLEQIGVPRPILLAIDEPVRVLVEAGYRRDIGPGSPTPAQLIPVNNPLSLARNFVASIPVGIDDALEASDLGRPLGTEPSGPFGVGGDDDDLKGLPAGFVPLGKPNAETAGPETVEPETVEPETKKTESAKAEPRKERPKPLRPKVRGPISFDAPKTPSLRKPGDRPLQRVFKSVAGQRKAPTDDAAPQPQSERDVVGHEAVGDVADE